MTVPEGAQLSEDGYYWWDGTDWQPVPDATNGESGGDITADELAQIQSPDQITERYQPYFQPDYEKVPDDESWAEVDADLPEDSGGDDPWETTAAPLSSPRPGT